MADDFASLAKRMDSSDDRLKTLERKQDEDRALADDRFSAMASDIKNLKQQMAASIGPPAPPPTWPTSGSKPTSPTASTTDRWMPSMLFVRGWSPYGSAPSTKVSREEINLLDEKLRAAVGPLSKHYDLVPPYAANHQLAYRVKNINIYDAKTALSTAIDSDRIEVHGQTLKVGLEQSVERKRNYAQFQSAIKQLHSDPGYADHIVECGRSLKLFAKKSWEVLGEPAPSGWVWHRSGFIDAKLELPCFLVESSVKTSEGQQDPEM